MTDRPTWVAEAAGPSLRDARRARWGFRHETWIVTLADGERRVFQRRTDTSDPGSSVASAIRRAVRAAGLPTPEPRVRDDLRGADASAATLDGRSALVLELPFVAATVAAELLGSPAGAAEAGRACGFVAARLATVDPPPGLTGRWASGERLLAAVPGWLDACGPFLPATGASAIEPLVRRASAMLDAGPARLAHGDLAPVNVLVADGEVAAVLDLDRVQVAHPAYDAAWFAWVVTFHHPDVAGAACEAFGTAAGTPATPGAIAWLWPLLLLERLADAADDAERGTWAARLAAAISPS